MKNNEQAEYNHKKMGAVVLLESSALLGKVLVSVSGDEFWVKLTDLTPLMDSVTEKGNPARKPLGPNRPNASPDSQYHVVSCQPSLAVFAQLPELHSGTAR
jgi:hypothetical protein